MDNGKPEDDKKKLRVAAYCRVSTSSDEQMTSFNAQIEYYEKYIKENPDCTFVGIFADEGISGTDIRKCDGFNLLIQNARDGYIDMIITKSLSRFGRNTLDCLNTIRELKSLGVDVFFEKENIHLMRSEGELLLTLISAVAQNESSVLSNNIKWGFRRKYESGHVQSIPSGKFLGYNKDENGLVINEAQAVTVRRIYQEFLDGYGVFQIASRLTKEKVPMAYGGKEWCASHIKKVLTNEKYKGDTLFQKTYTTNYLTKHRAKNNGELPQYYSEDTHPAIIDKDTWKCVQLEFERQKQYCIDHKIEAFHQNNEKHPLSAKIICSICGCTFVFVESKRVGEKGRKYWHCNSFLGYNGTEIEGQMFTPHPSHRSSTNKSVIQRRKDPKARQMLCTDVEIEEGVPEKAFIHVWNQLVDEYEQSAIKGDNVLTVYRAKELVRLLKENGHIEKMSYELIHKTLDHIEIGYDGSVEVIFFTGTRVEIENLDTYSVIQILTKIVLSLKLS